MKVGVWKSFAELEENLTMPELDLLLTTIIEERQEDQIFQAGIQGIDLSKAFGDPLEDKRKEIERRAMERLGKAAEFERNEFADIGIELISDEEE